MSGSIILDWALLAVSLFNTILLLWLGLVVLLTAERRTWGIWLAGGGLLAGAAFFVSHSTILIHNLTYLGPGTEFWWRVGWTALVVLPYAWYILMLWYAGFWEARSSALRRSHQVWLLVTAAITLGLLILVVFPETLPDYSQTVELNLGSALELAGVPIMLIAFPLHAILNVSLALAGLAHPEPSRRRMGALARRRAHPWLVGASIALLIASLLVVAILTWIAVDVRQARTLFVDTTVVLVVAWFDLAIATTIGVAVVLLGRAIVAYEIFTGHNLPRQGFLRHWQRMIILAAGYSVVVAGSLTAGLRPIYIVLLTAAIMTTFFAMLVWRSFDEREQAIRQLRPFVSSQGLYDHLLGGGAASFADADVFFVALCENVLGAGAAYLIPAGSSTALMRSPIVYPGGSTPPGLSSQDLVRRMSEAEAMPLAIDPDRYGGAAWAVPLSREGELSGVLLLGEKRDGGLYTQEEIEIARAGGERVVDIQVGAEMARRLMALQRQKLAEGQIIDQRPRRVLHDDVLPRLHAAMLGLSAGEPTSEVMSLLAETHRQVSDLLHEMPTRSAPEVARLGLVGALRQELAVELPNSFDDVSWEIEPDVTLRIAEVPDLATEVVFYAAREAMRNAARHGRGGSEEASPLALHVRVAWQTGLIVEIQDNGAGICLSDAETAGTGQGLALHSTLMAVIGGTLEVDGAAGRGTRVTLRLPRA